MSVLEDVKWSRELVEAHFAADIAEIALEDARRNLIALKRGDGTVQPGNIYYPDAVAAAYEAIGEAEARRDAAFERYRKLALLEAGVAT